MPRFGIKKLMVIVAAIALWLATFRAPDPTNRGVGTQLRLAILLAILIAAGFAAIYFRGKRQAFWAGFFVSLLLLRGQFLKNTPDLLPIARSWSAGAMQALPANDSVAEMLAISMWAALLISFSAAVGFIVALIYAQSQSRK